MEKIEKTDEEWREARRRDWDKEPAYHKVARADLTGAWRKHAQIELRGEVTVSVRLRVPLLLPGLKSPLKVGSTADTVLEDGDLSDRQDTTPHKNEFGEEGNWNRCCAA